MRILVLALLIALGLPPAALADDKPAPKTPYVASLRIVRGGK